jgi:hypothetical protein
LNYFNLIKIDEVAIGDKNIFTTETYLLPRWGILNYLIRREQQHTYNQKYGERPSPYVCVVGFVAK